MIMQITISIKTAAIYSLITFGMKYSGWRIVDKSDGVNKRILGVTAMGRATELLVKRESRNNYYISPPFVYCNDAESMTCHIDTGYHFSHMHVMFRPLSARINCLTYSCMDPHSPRIRIS